MDYLRILTIRQPWAGAVAFLGKDIENRSQRWSYRATGEHVTWARSAA